MQNQRLFEILHLLLRRGNTTAGELAERFGVSARTIYRDVDALSSAGVPVYAEKGRGGGIRLLPDYVLDKTLLSKAEQAQLLGHLESLAALGAPDGDAVLDKLGALFGRSDSWLEVDFAPWAGGEQMRELFRLLRDAILQRQVVAVRYAGISPVEVPPAPADMDSGPTKAPLQPQTERKVEPYKVFFRGQGWYLLGWCRLRRAFRYFKLTRILDARLTGEDFVADRPAPPADIPYSGPTAEVVLRFEGGMAFRVLDEFGPDEAKPQPDGSYVVRIRLPSGDDWLPGYLLSYGPGLEVLAPQALRRTVAGMLRRTLQHYGPE